jgi:hypothetical protein
MFALYHTTNSVLDGALDGGGAVDDAVVLSHGASAGGRSRAQVCNSSNAATTFARLVVPAFR